MARRLLPLLQSDGREHDRVHLHPRGGVREEEEVPDAIVQVEQLRLLVQGQRLLRVDVPHDAVVGRHRPAGGTNLATSAGWNAQTLTRNRKNPPDALPPIVKA